MVLLKYNFDFNEIYTKLYNDDEFLQELIDILLKENLPF